jgi:hypothetical protein
MADFIECGTVSINYNMMGIVTVNYTVITDSPSMSVVSNSLSYGGQTFSGYISDVSVQSLTNMVEGSDENWYAMSVTLTATT